MVNFVKSLSLQTDRQIIIIIISIIIIIIIIITIFVLQKSDLWYKKVW